ncbi:unnamed protein product [Adineta ricciae]|uniref:Uncharacterized protein n=1 Tax=Adineta ricciae TaxID=249248 RepID=A0A815WBM0_ADIRI|nr:unnamed protein product [Adineta ricciae]CAF1677709.1 unnamed protein product [Adineta ricciae]
MGTIFSDGVHVSENFITNLRTGLNGLTIFCCVVVVILHIYSYKNPIDSFKKIFNKIFVPTAVREVLVCQMGKIENQAQLSSTLTQLYQVNDQLTHIKPARYFYLLIFPMQLYIMFLIFESKIITEQETPIGTINSTVSLTDQRKYYRCFNNTAMCTSYIFKTENVIDTVTNLIAWWQGLCAVINKMISLSHNNVMKKYYSNKSIPSQNRIHFYRFMAWFALFLFIVYIATDIGTDIGSTWFPLVLSLILLCVAGLSAGAEHHQNKAENNDFEMKNTAAYLKQLNEAQPVLIVKEKLQETSDHSKSTGIHQRQSSKVAPVISESLKT